MTLKHLAEPSRAVSWTHTGPLIGNPVLDREKISAPQAVDVRMFIIRGASRQSAAYYVLLLLCARLSFCVCVCFF